MKTDKEWLFESDKCGTSDSYLALIRAIQADALRHAAEIARKHRAPRRKVVKAAFMTDEARQAIVAEERGEQIAAEEICKALKAEADRIEPLASDDRNLRDWKQDDIPKVP
jgi:hypothetical protein